MDSIALDECHDRAATPDAVPVKIVIERRPRDGADERFRAWTKQFVTASSRAAGHQGGSVLSAPDGSHVILLRFATADHLHAWQHSTCYLSLMREAEAFSTSGDEFQVRSGFETWFTLPGKHAPGTPPPKWKMALLTWLALLPMVIALGYLLAPLRLPRLLNATVSTGIPVLMLTWVVMPQLTRMLYTWLYRRSRSIPSSNRF